MERLVGSRTIQRLKTRTLPAGLRDVQEWTGVTLTFMRRDGMDWPDIVTLPAISIRLNSATPREALGGVETTSEGTLKVWAEHVSDENEVKQGDRFSWEDNPCVVTLVHPVKLDTYVTIEFRFVKAGER